MEADEAVIREFYDHFNERRFDRAAALFTEDAVLEHAARRGRPVGGDAFLEFAQVWTTAFPDAHLAVERIQRRNDVTYEVDLLARGTHTGALDMGAAGVFKPSGVNASLRLRQLIELRHRRISFSSLSFDFQDIVQQLVCVDTSKLLDHLARIQQLADRLRSVPADDVVARRSVIERLGTELDAARRVVRPYFDK